MNGERRAMHELIESALKGSTQAVYDFYTILWESEVYLPVKSSSDSSVDDKSFDGEFSFVSIEGRHTLAVFTSEEFGVQWSEQRVRFVPRLFRTLIWLIKPDVWIHINPGQECGKEMSAWELGKLRDGGLDALDEIVAEIVTPEDSDVEVFCGDDLYPELKRRLKSLLEVFSEVEEAFLIRVVSQGDKEATFNKKGMILLGLIHSGLSKLQCLQIEEEAKMMAVQEIAQDEEFAFVSSINDRTNIMSGLFNEVIPFYYMPETLRTDFEQDSDT